MGLIERKRVAARRAEPSGEVRVSLRGRPLMIFIGIGTVILLASLFAVGSLSRLSDQMDRAVEGASARSVLLARLNRAMLLMRVSEKNFLSWTSDEQLRDFEGRLRAAEAEMERGLRELRSSTSGEMRDRVAAFAGEYERFRESVGRVVELSRRDSLQEAVGLSQGRGRDLLQQGRLILLALIERNRAVIARGVGAEDLLAMSERTARARGALESVHDMGYFEQAALATRHGEDRSAVLPRLRESEEAVSRAIEELRGSPVTQDVSDMKRLREVMDQWAGVSAEVWRLATEDTKAQAMVVSTGIARDGYSRSAELLDGLLLQMQSELAQARAKNERGLSVGRLVVLACGLLGVAVVAGLLTLLVRQVVAEYRLAAVPFVRGQSG